MSRNDHQEENYDSGVIFYFPNPNAGQNKKQERKNQLQERVVTISLVRLFP